MNSYLETTESQPENEPKRCIEDLTHDQLCNLCYEHDKELKNQREELRSFVHTMAHDIRGCFNGVLGYAQLLKEVYNPKYADTIVDTVQRMIRLLDRSVRLADLGETVGWLTEVDMNRLVSFVAASVIPKDVEFFHGRLPTVLGDYDKLSQACQNIFINAMEHGHARRIEVLIESTDGGTNLLFRNDGNPIPKEIREKILNERISSKKDGGIGLGIVKRIIEAHGWSIRLDQSQRITFRIFIPDSAQVQKNQG